MKQNVVIKILFFLFAFVHFLIVLIYFTPSFSDLPDFEHKIVFCVSKFLALLFLILFYQAIPFAFYKIKNKNHNFINFFKYLIAYFLLSIALIFITQPFSLSSFDSYYIISNIENYGIFWRQNFIPSILFLTAKSIFPSYYTVSILCCLIYSFIFSYCVCNTKEKFGKIYYLILLFFILPSILICSLVQYNNILCAYLLGFILLFTFFNENKQIKNIVKALLFGFLCTIVILLRSENIFLLVVLPLMVFNLKIFHKKSYITYIVSLILLFSPLYYIQKIHINYEYVLHNLSFIYDFYKIHNIQVKNEDKKIIEKIFPVIKTEYYGSLADYANYNTEIKDKKNAVKCLIKMAVEQAPIIMKNNIKIINSAINSRNFMPLKMSRENKVYDDGSFYKYPVKSKIISLMAYGTTIFRLNAIYKLLYDLNIGIYLLILFLIYSLIRCRKFFIYTTVILTVNIASVLLFMPFYTFFYFYQFLFITRLITVFLFAEVFYLKFNKNRN